MRSFLVALATGTLAVALAAPLTAQSAALVYTLGKDTVAIEQYTRTATSVEGEMVQRAGAAVTRFRYRVDVGRDGRPTAASLERMQGDGTPFPNVPRTWRFTFGADSVVREAVFADSTQRRAFAARGATFAFPTYVYGPLEILAALRRRGTAVDSIAAVGVGGAVSYAGLRAVTGDTVRYAAGGGAYPMLLRFDARDRLLSVDGSLTTNKVLASRVTGTFDIAAVARAMRPTGVLSLRETVRAGFGPGGMVLIDYGRPHVRERTVWGGTLVPFDSIWRAGANDATHLFTTRTLTFGDVTLAPGTYTLWVQHTRGGTFLIVNRQTGQWGTQYDPAQDLGRVAIEIAPAAAPVEEFTITIRATGPARGAITLAWGDRTGTVPFGIGAAR